MFTHWSSHPLAYFPHSLAPSLSCSFNHLLAHLFIYMLTHLFIHSLVHSFFIHPLIHWLTHSFLGSLIHSQIYIEYLSDKAAGWANL